MENFLLRKISNLCASKFASSNNDDLIQLLKDINSFVKRFNNFECDYLAHDYYGCCLAGAVIEKDQISMANIGNSNVLLLDKDFNILYKLPDTYTENKHLKPFALAELYPDAKGWKDNKTRAKSREFFRNTEVLYDGKLISFGVLTGEEGAHRHIYTHIRTLEDVYYIAIITDGYLPYFTELSNKEVLERLFCSNKVAIDTSIAIGNNEEYGGERTLVAYKRIK